MISARQAYDTLANVYDSSFTSKTAQAEDDIIYSQLKSFLKYSSVLDLGCGTGALLEHLDIEPENYVGIDLSENMIKLAQQKFPNYTFKLGDMANLPLDDAQFDNVVSLYGGISYADPKVFGEVLRILKPKGKFFLMLFNRRYVKRKTYILNRHGLKVDFYSFQDVKDQLPHNCTSQGFNFHGDFFNFLPRRVIRWILQAERKLLGKLFKTKAFFCLVYGVKD